MLTNDLFNTDYERRISEGAVDQLEQRRIDDLNMKMDELAKRVKTTADKAHRESLLKAFLKCKEERDSYYKIKEAGIPGNLPPEQVPGKEDLLKGKGRQTYEAVVTPPDAQQRAIETGRGVYNELLKSWEEKKPYIMLPVPGGNLSLTRNQIFNVLLAVKNMKDPEYKKLLATTFNNADKFMSWLPSVMKYKIPQEKPEPAPAGIMPGGQVATQASLPIKEAGQKKKSDITSPKDIGSEYVLQNIRKQYPQATSDLAALARKEIDDQARDQQKIDQLDGVNKKQDQDLDKVMQYAQQQSSKVNQLSQQVRSTPQGPATAPVQSPATAATPEKTVAAKVQPIYIANPEKLPAKDQEIYNRVKELEQELSQKIDAMASWNKVAQQDTGAQAELTALRKDVEGTKNRLASMQKKINKYAIPAPAEINMGKAMQVRPGDILKRSAKKEPEFQFAPATTDDDYNIISQNDFDQLSAAGLGRTEEPSKQMAEGRMGEIDAMRQDLERMNERQFYTAYGLSKAAFQQRYRALLKPAEPGYTNENIDDDDWEEDEGDFVNDPTVHAQVKPQPLPDTVLRAIERNPNMRADIIAAYKRSQGVKEGWSDAIVAQRTGRPRTPYSVYIKGKKWRDFENEDHAEAVANKLRAKFKAEGRDSSVITIAATGSVDEGDTVRLGDVQPGTPGYDAWRKSTHQTAKPGEKVATATPGKQVQAGADKQHLMPRVVPEAGSPAQQAAIAIAMKKAGKKPKHVDEMDKSQPSQERHGDYPLGIKNKDVNMVKPTTKKKVVKDLTKDLEKAFSKEKEVKEDYGSWIVYDPETKQIKKRFKTHTAGKSYAQTHKLGFASSEYYFDNVKQQAVVEDDPMGGATVDIDQMAGAPDDTNPGNLDETQTDYQKRRAQDRKDMELGEESYTKVMESQGITDAKLLAVARRIDAFAKTIK